MSYYFRISVIKYIYWYFVTADGFQNGCQELGSKYNMYWMLAWKSFRWQIKFQYRRTIAIWLIFTLFKLSVHQQNLIIG